MTIRNLDKTLAPASIALIGASPREGSVGRVVLENVVNGGFQGRIYPVNLKHDDILGQRCYRRLADLPEAPDLAIIMTPPSTVPELISDLGKRGGKAVVVITAGINDSNGLRQQMLDAARPHMLRIIGPNTIGLLAPHAALNASFVHITPRPGRLGLISQSGAIVSSVIDWAAAEGIGFSGVYSLGDMADVDVGDCLNMLAADIHTTAILMYIESIPATRKFMSAARAAARIKPVIAVKPGRHAEAARAAQTHTGALAGADRVIDAALIRAGIIRVDDLEDLFNAAEITARFSPMETGRVAIVTNGGGAGVLAIDKLLDHGCTLATLTPETLARMDKDLPPTWSHANPIDIIGDAPPERYAAAIEAAAADPGVDALLVMNCPTAIADPAAAARGVAALSNKGRVNGKPLLACWLGKQAAEPARVILQEAGIASFDTPAAAAEAVDFLTHWSNLRKILQRTPASHTEFPVDKAAAETVIAEVARDGRTLLTEAEAKAVLTAYRIPSPETVVAVDENAVEAAATRLLASAPAVVVKMLSKTVSHKSDIGGVILDLRSAAAARQAAATIRARFADRYPTTPLDGFTVQAMIKRQGATELIIGLSTDPSFGPTIVFGSGGTSVEVVDDVATGLVPLDEVLAGDLIDKTRISKLLAGYRDRRPADRAAIVKALLGLSQLAIDLPAVTSVDINPVLADADGVLALDARIEIDASRIGEPAPNRRLAIRPYPAAWEKTSDVGGFDLEVRPIRPEDAALYPAYLDKMDPEDMRRRFLVPLRIIPPDMLVRLTQLDYDRDIGFVAIDRKTGELLGITRYSAEPDKEWAEFGTLVRSDLKGRGIGRMLMQWLVAYARSEGLKRIEGTILKENTAMIALCKELGFTFEQHPDGAELWRGQLALTDAAGQG